MGVIIYCHQLQYKAICGEYRLIEKTVYCQGTMDSTVGMSLITIENLQLKMFFDSTHLKNGNKVFQTLIPAGTEHAPNTLLVLLEQICYSGK